MAEVLLFHHALGRTASVDAFAEHLRGAGHQVHVPDLFDGQVFDRIEDGVAHAEAIGFPELVERGQAIAGELPSALVYAGFSLGVLPAQALAQNRPGATGALLVHACVPTEAFGSWPAGVPVQVHAMDADPFFVDDGDLDAAQALVEHADAAELFLYPGSDHLFAESGLPSHDAAASTLLRQRALDFLAAV